MIKKVLFVFIILSSALVYQVFDSGRLVNQSSVNIIENNEIKVANNLDNSEFYLNIMQVENSIKPSTLATSKICHSALYVSDVMSNSTQYNNQSLINLLKYFKEDNYKSTEIRNILLSSELYERTEIEMASVLFEPPTYMSKKLNKEQLLYNFKQIERFVDDNKSLVEALRSGELDTNMNLSFFYGHPKTIIEFLLEKKGVIPDISTFQSLVNAGVPIRPNTILNALAKNVGTDILLLMIKHLPESDRNHRWDDFFNGGFNFSYTSFAAKNSNPKSLNIILTESLGDSSDAINILLEDKMEYDQRPKPMDILQLAADSHIFNTKLDMLLEYDIPVDAELLSSYLNSKSVLKDEQKMLLTQKRKNMDQEVFNKIDKDLSASVLSYAKKLQVVQKLWPEFIFSYDPYCTKIPANSSYRVNNLIEKEILVNLLPTDNTTDTHEIIAQIQLKGDIYLDWYFKKNIYLNIPKEIRVKADRSDKKLRSVSALINANIVLGHWSDIEDLLSNNSIPLDYVYRNNAYLIELGIQERVPQDILFDWFNRGVMIHNSSLDELLAIEEYSEFTMELLNKGILTNKSHKSILFQAARNKNIKLIKLLLMPAFKNKPFNNNKGLTALNWTLLNYDSEIKLQLEVLLAQEIHLSLEQKEILIKLK